MCVTFITLLWVSCWPGHQSAGVRGQCSDLSLCYTTQARTFGGCLRSQRSIYRSTDLCLYCMCASIYPSSTNDAFSVMKKGNGSQSGWVDLKGIVHPKNKTHLFQTCDAFYFFFGWTIPLRSRDQCLRWYCVCLQTVCLTGDLQPLISCVCQDFSG